MYLESSGMDTCKITNQITTKTDKDKKGNIINVYYELSILQWADILVFNRFLDAPYEPLVKTMIQAAKHYKTAIVYETDDDFYNIPLSNPVRENALRALPLIRIMTEAADAYTVTTKRLGDTLLANSIREKPVYVLPNSVEIGRFVTKHDLFIKPKKPGVIRIGWSGGATHVLDFKKTGCFDALKEIVATNNDVEFVFMGSSNVNDIFDFKHESVGFVPIDIFPETLRSLDLDIALCPLENYTFNANKSAIKWEEYSACGYVTVYSDVPPYSDVIKHGKTGFAVNNTKEEWLNTLNRLIADKELRTRTARLAFSEVYNKFNMEKNFMLWHKAYKEVLKR